MEIVIPRYASPGQVTTWGLTPPNEWQEAMFAQGRARVKDMEDSPLRRLLLSLRDPREFLREYSRWFMRGTGNMTGMVSGGIGNLAASYGPMGSNSSWPMTDNFTGSAGNLLSHTADTGQSWDSVNAQGGGAAYAITGSGACINNTLSNRQSVALVEVGRANMSATITASAAGAVGNGWGVSLRASDANNYIWGGWQTNSGGQFFVAKTVAGAFTTAGTFINLAPATGDTVEVSVTGTGAGNTVLKHNTVTRITATINDAALNSLTKGGLADFVGGGTQYWDKIVIARL